MTLCKSNHFYCDKKCCKLHIKEYIPRKIYYSRYNNAKKAGIIIYGKNTGKILLIQSNGNLWGFPKGSIENGETTEECALRETYEETGISFPESFINSDSRLFSSDKKCVFYIIEFNEIPVSICHIPNYSDSTGISWMNISCIKDMVFSKKIRLNKYCWDILNNFF